MMEEQSSLFEGLPVLPPPPSVSQKEFDSYYITATEIAREIGLTRVAVHYGRQRGILPNPIGVGDGLVYIWKRSEIKPYIDAWKFRINEKKGLQA